MVKKKVLIILGASSGIGRELIKKLNKKFRIIAFYNKGKITNNLNITKVKLDFNSDLRELDTKFKKLIKSNSNIVLVNFAAIKVDKISYHINEKEFNKTIKVNTFAFLKIIQNLLPQMIKNRWGRIINISSVGGLKGDKGTLLYSASKKANEAMMKVMSKEYGVFNIFFNTLKLGNFNFGLFKKLDKKIKKELVNKVPTKTTGNIKNIVSALELLIKSDYINGSSIKIDGGSD